MANLSSIARPYALAAFDYAREHQQLGEWKAFLLSASNISRQQSVQKLLANPEISTQELYRFFEGILVKNVSQEQKNFLRLLAQKRRLNALPEMVEAYNAHVATLEKVCNARVITAVAAEDSFIKSIKTALAKKTQRDVNVFCEVEPAIIGGAIIHLGDNVIDGSVRGKLNRLLEFLLR